ncbi:unnamed protein product [Larinioides sclopetarius]|uniref:Uncharacterized protein n=1 Tax=Larinioides sclopetarius TaxID=280406 RepID=A0AAV2BED0_9ARAC
MCQFQAWQKQIHNKLHNIPAFNRLWNQKGLAWRSIASTLALGPLKPTPTNQPSIDGFVNLPNRKLDVILN